jgi:uncharacterized protein (TIGR02145 family)
MKGQPEMPEIVKRKNRYLLFPALFLAIMALLAGGCSKKENNYIFFYPESKTVKDADGNIYHLAYIKGQTWMVENLKTTHYRNGDTIQEAKDSAAWSKAVVGAYCNYNNDTAMAITYGRLYNWNALTRSDLCPYPWHVPYDFEWQEMVDTLGGAAAVGGMLKETGTTHWQSGTGATNQYGFTALPGGRVDNTGTFHDIGLRGYWWSNKNSLDMILVRSISHDDASIFRSEADTKSGYSVRCVRDY